VLCPAALKGTVVNLKSSDGQLLTLSAEAACISSDLKRTLEQASPEKEIELPFKKSLLAKLVAYFQYHEARPFAEIRTPLEFDTLLECGALKYDAGFVQGSKDELFDLMLAAQHMDIPSLLFLTGAQVMLMVKDKDAAFLRKQFGLVNDMPTSEQETLDAVMATRRESLKDRSADAGVAAMAIFVSGITSAAQKHGLSVLGKGHTPSDSSMDTRSLRYASWRAVVLEDWRQLLIAPDEIKDDKELMRMLLVKSSGRALQYAGDEVLDDQSIIEEAVKLNGEMLRYASPEFREDRDAIMEAIMWNGLSFAEADEDLRGDRELVLEASKKGRGSAMKGATKELQADIPFVLDCIEHDPEAFKYVAEELRRDRDFTISAVSRNGGALQYALTSFQADREVVQIAVANDRQALTYAHAARRAEMNRSMPWDGEQQGKLDPAQIGAQGTATAPVSWFHEGVALVRRDVGSTMGEQPWILKLGHMCYMSAVSTMMNPGMMGQGNYIAANVINDTLPGIERYWDIDSCCLGWGAVGNGIGMRWKAFASADPVNLDPDSYITILQARSILKATCTWWGVHDYVAGAMMGNSSAREYFLQQTAGRFGIQKPSADEQVLAHSSSPELKQRRVSDGGEAAGRDAEGTEAGQLTGLDQEASAQPAPLGGWPDLLGVEDTAAFFEPGARVQLVGVSSTAGETGVLISTCSGGKWKVKLDSNKGNAVLREEYLRVVAAPGEAALGAGLSAVAPKAEAAPKVEATPSPAAAKREAERIRRDAEQRRAAQIKQKREERKLIAQAEAEEAAVRAEMRAKAVTA